MKVKSISLLFISTLILLSLNSCSWLHGLFGGKNSSTTGWKYNSKDNGGFVYKDNYEQPTGPGLVYIPGGTFVMGQTLEDVMKVNNNRPRRVTVASFYMDETEVRNIDYLEYLYWLRRVFDKQNDVYHKALPDTLVWRSALSYNEPLVRNYLRFKAYAQYPVVGVSWEQASQYCKWRTDRVNEQILIDKGILKHSPDTQKGSNNFTTDTYLTGLYKGEVKNNVKNLDGSERAVNWSDGVLLPSYRLPTEAEWEYAAYGLVGNTTEERIMNKRVFPWDGSWVRDASRKHRGEFLANFVRGKGDYSGVAPYNNDGGVQTVDVHSYKPNDFGLYCMAGNVNEWVSDVYRQASFDDVSEVNPYRGNVFKKVVIDPTTKEPKKDSLGRLVYTLQTKEDLKNRKNYRMADNRDYIDGDFKSTINANSSWLQKPSKKKNMYNPSAKELTSLVSNTARVYKGGSWKDRVFWLSPGSRRFLDQKRATDDIGFRCAMSHVGKRSK
ncbi:MAG: SUMF1/EgtB/PvdO family nonheme iron enzyme [Marinifilaceae bacterium]|jgi:gliding motility-associated lipoprotein GldJ|nr:SUMF1/EgtB/PvdO family nonheme iron enzyme [Marinifilaceae bacterium]